MREEELKNRVATLYFGKYDCTRIVGNIDFCVLPKRRDPRQMTLDPLHRGGGRGKGLLCEPLYERPHKR